MAFRPKCWLSVEMVLVEQYVGLSGGFTKLVGRAGEKRGDVAYFVATTAQSTWRRFRGHSRLQFPVKHGTSTVMRLGIWHSSV